MAASDDDCARDRIVRPRGGLLTRARDPDLGEELQPRDDLLMVPSRRTRTGDLLSAINALVAAVGVRRTSYEDVRAPWSVVGTGTCLGCQADGIAVMVG
jgi:hypothetical protein